MIKSIQSEINRLDSFYKLINSINSDERDIIVYLGPYVNFALAISKHQYVKSLGTIYYAETHEHVDILEDMHKISLDTTIVYGDDDTRRREIAFILYTILEEESARIEMRELFVSGHEKNKYIYIMHNIMPVGYMDEDFEDCSSINGQMGAFTTPMQCIKELERINQNSDERFAVDILPINNSKTEIATMRSFFGNYYRESIN